MLVNTTHGEMDDSLLRRKDIIFENDNERTEAVEYYLDEELVHRSAHVTLKDTSGLAAALVGDFGK